MITAFPIYRSIVLTKIFKPLSALSLTAEQTSEIFYLESVCEKNDQNTDDLVNDPNYKDHNKRKNAFYNEWAEALAKRLALGQKIPDLEDESGICAYIKNKKLAKGYSEYEIEWIGQSLPDKFKRPYTKPSQLGNEELQTYKQKTAITSLYELPADEIKKGWKEAKAAVDHYEFVAKHKQIALVGHKEREDPISTVLPEPGKSELYYAALDVYQEAKLFVDNWEGVVKKIEQFPIKDKKADRVCARKLRSLANFFNGFGRLLPTLKDEKYGQSLWGWFQTVVWEEGFGKHAAAVKSKIAPKGETKKPRPFTRERVGDAKERYWKDMQAFGKAMQAQAWWEGLIDWRDHFGEVSQRIADRRNREGPLLSETAFSAERS